MTPNNGYSSEDQFNDENVQREIARARYKGFGLGLISAWAIAVGGLEMALKLENYQILPEWKEIPNSAIEIEYNSQSELKSLNSQPRIYDVVEGKSLSSYIIKMERERLNL